MWEGLDRNRQVLFDPSGGHLTGSDPSGLYADGEAITLPEARRSGYTLTGWSDGGQTYAPGDTYTVNGSVILTAQWGEN